MASGTCICGCKINEIAIRALLVHWRNGRRQNAAIIINCESMPFPIMSGGKDKRRNTFLHPTLCKFRSTRNNISFSTPEQEY